MSDPLSGLVTGGKFDGEAVRIRVVEPAKPDIEAVRTAMESVLDENSELRVNLPGAIPAPAPRPVPVVDGAAPPTPPVGLPAPAARVPVAPEEPPPLPPVRPPRRRWSPGLAAVGLLLIVMAVLAIVMLASLIDAISSIFS
jgi:hypothetical protein